MCGTQMRCNVLIEERCDDRKRSVHRDESDQQLEIVLVSVVHQINGGERGEIDVAQAVHDAVERGVLAVLSAKGIARDVADREPIRSRQFLDSECEMPRTDDENRLCRHVSTS